MSLCSNVYASFLTLMLRHKRAYAHHRAEVPSCCMLGPLVSSFYHWCFVFLALVFYIDEVSLPSPFIHSRYNLAFTLLVATFPDYELLCLVSALP